jgi:hypothetical protein
VGGPKPNAPCVFPFKFQGEVYNGCPVDLEDPSKRWCSTRVDANGEHITGAGEFGHCGPDCPIHGTFSNGINRFFDSFKNLFHIHITCTSKAMVGLLRLVRLGWIRLSQVR